MSAMWYYAIAGEKHGPIGEDELRHLIEKGDLGLDDLVWRSGMEDWKPVSDVDDVHPSPPPLPNEKEAASPPPISENKQDRLTESPDSVDLDSDDPSSSKEEEGSVAVGSETPSGPEKSTETVAKAVGDKTVGVTYAGFGSRLVAYVIDIFITVVVTSVLGGIALFVDPSADAELLTRGIGVLVTWFYFAGFESSDRQATPGKQFMGLKVTDAQMSYDKIGFKKASGRHFGKILSGLIFLLGFIMAAFTEKKQALHDKMAGCLVVEDG